MSVDRQEKIDVISGESTPRTRTGGPPVHRGVHWLTPWWRTWDVKERTFARHAYDPRKPLEENIRMAATDFQKERPWPFAGADRAHSSWRLWEQFRLAIGLSYRPTLPRLAREGSNEEDGDASSDDEDLLPRESPTFSHAGAKKHRVFRGVGAFYEEEDDKAGERGMTPHEQWLLHTAEMSDNMARFTFDAEKVMKHLFSSYFFHHRLVGTPEACENMPVIASYFLRFLLRHIDFDQYDKAMFERALAVTELARTQMPLICEHTHFHWQHPTLAGDVFATFCRATFGEIPPAHDDLAMIFSNSSNSSLAANDSGADSPASEASGSFPSTPTLEGPTELPVVNSSEDIDTHEAEGAGKADSGEADDPWTLKKPNLPLPDLSLTHIRGLAEASIRRIVGVFPPSTTSPSVPVPDGAVERVLVRTSWSIELAPEPSFRSWRTPDWEAWPGYESASLRIQTDGRDSRDTTIRLIVSPVVGTALTRCVGMLLCGDFAELVPRIGSQGEVWYLH